MKKILSVALLIIVCIALLVACVAADGPDTPYTPEDPADTTPPAITPVPPIGELDPDDLEQIEDPEPTPLSGMTRDNSGAVLTTLFSGTFFVGQDIPAGRYVITGDSSGNLFVHRDGYIFPAVSEILDDGTGIINIGVPSVTADLLDGDEIEISGINNVVFTPAVTELSTILTTGDWAVGMDIPAGTFDVVPTYDDESGNIFVNEQGRILPVVNEILAGPDSASGQMNIGVERVRVNLQDGQTIRITNISSVTFFSAEDMSVIRDAVSGVGLSIISIDGVVSGNTLGDIAYEVTTDVGIIQVELHGGNVIAVVQELGDGRIQFHYMHDDLKAAFADALGDAFDPEAMIVG